MDRYSLRMLGSSFCWVKMETFPSCRYLFDLMYFHIYGGIQHQASHIPLSPGKKHSIQVSGSHITTTKNPSLWRLEGNSLYEAFNIYLITNFPGLLKMENLVPMKRGCRFPWEAELLTFHSRCFYIFC